MSTPPYPLQPEPMKTSWLEHRPLWKIPLGCLTLILLIGVSAIILITIITTSFHNSEVYKQAMARAAENSRVRDAIGEPIRSAWLFERKRQHRLRESFDSYFWCARERRDPRRRIQDWWNLAVYLPASKRGWPAGMHRSAVDPTSRTGLLSGGAACI